MATREAQNVFKSLCEMLDSNDLGYKKDEEKLSVQIKFKGEDIPMTFDIHVDEKRDLVVIRSMLPFKAEDDRLVEMTIAICQINYVLADGSFDIDVRDGELSFKLTSSYKSSLLSKSSLEYMIGISCATVDRYNDKLMEVNAGFLNPFDITK